MVEVNRIRVIETLYDTRNITAELSSSDNKATALNIFIFDYGEEV
jgi:hypothetical protein